LQQTKYAPRRQLGFDEPEVNVSSTYTSLSQSHASTVNMFATVLKPSQDSTEAITTMDAKALDHLPETPAQVGLTYQQLSTQYPSTIAMFGSVLSATQNNQGELP
jgi:hypothetical protein